MGGNMQKSIFLLFVFALGFSGTLKEDGIAGIDIEVKGKEMRYLTPTSPGSPSSFRTTVYDRSRAQVLWVDRNHQYAIAEHVALSGNGMCAQVGWWLNNKRTSHYRTLGSEIPIWNYPLPLTEWYLPVGISLTGDDIAAGATGEPFYSFSSTINAPKWFFNLPAGFKIATCSQGPSVAVSDNGAVYAVLARSTDVGKLFIFNQQGDTIRTITFSQNNGIYGLDISNDGTVLCVSTYYATYIYNLDGTRRDSLYNYSQTTAKISGDGKYLVKGHFNGRVYLYRWTGVNYTLKWEHYTGHPWVTAVAISDNGATIMAGTFQYSPTYAGKVLMYDSSSATPLWEYTQYGDFVDECALSADGTRGAAVSWGQYQGTFGDVLTVFNKSSSTPLFQLLDDIDEPGSLTSVDISKDGSFVIAGGKAVHAREFGNGGEVYAIRIIEPWTSDVGVKSIDVPGNFLQTGQSIAPQAIVKNYGTSASSFNTLCFIYDSLGTLLYQSTMPVNNLPGGAEQTLTFSPNWTVPAYGKYSTMVITTLTGDQYPANDTLKKGSICYHDGAVTRIEFPFSELTLNYTRPPRVTIANQGSYAENIPVVCNIYDSGNNLVYTGTGQAYLNPLQSSTIWLNPAWTPNITQTYTAHFYTTVNDDYNRANDTLRQSISVTTEILYDDGNLDIYGYVSSNYYDNKFAQRMIPCLTPPFVITGARFYASTSAPMLISIHADSAGLPGLNPSYYIAPPETIFPAGTGWAVKTYSPPIIVTSSNPFWLVLHWFANSPTSPYVGMDNTIPRDSVAFWYWTEPSNYGWHPWYTYDFMMRVATDYLPGVAQDNINLEKRLIFYPPLPNPFTGCVKISISVPEEKEIALNIYDVTGRLIKNLVTGKLKPGKYTFMWDGRDTQNRKLGAGIYFVKADGEKENYTEKIILVQ